MNAVRGEVAAIDADQPVFTAQTVEQMQAQATWRYRVFGTLFAVFVLIALHGVSRPAAPSRSPSRHRSSMAGDESA